MYSYQLCRFNYTFPAIFLEVFLALAKVNLLITRLFHNHIKAGNNLFLSLKQFVSKGETICFQCRNKSETISER